MNQFYNQRRKKEVTEKTIDETNMCVIHPERVRDHYLKSLLSVDDIRKQSPVRPDRPVLTAQTKAGEQMNS